MKKWLACILLLISLTAEAAFVYRVEIDGVSSEQAKDLQSQLDIEAWHDSPEMNLEQLQRLHAQTPERLQELMATYGYFNARVQAELKQEGEQWLARYDISPGQQAKVGQLDIQFEGAIADENTDPDSLRRRQTLLSRWPLKPGAGFEQGLWRDGKKVLLEVLTSEKYPFARLESSSATVSEGGLGVDLKLLVASGPRVRFGALRISGLSEYPELTVQNLNTIDPGDDFSREALLNYQSRLIQSGYFAGVLVDIQASQRSLEQDSQKIETADILVQLTELKKQQVRLGVGYSTDSRERAQIGYEHRNIFKLGWRWSALIKADQQDQELSTEIAFPAEKTLYQDSVGYSIEHNTVGESETYDNRIYGKRKWGDTRFERTFSVELLNEYLRRVVVSADAPAQELEQTTITASLAYIWIKRDVDDLVFPTRGHIRHFEALIGTQLEISPYMRFYARLNRYLPLGRKWLFLGRAELGTIVGTIENVPADYLFLSGGDNTIRGYPYQSLGLKPDSKTLGSQTMAVASTEVQYWFTSKWGGAAFLDIGSLGAQLLRDPWKQGYGIGLRWRSPVGPLNLDYAWGRQANDYQIHFSLGLAF